MVRTYQRWKGLAKDMLYNYRFNKDKLAAIEDDIINGSGPMRDNQYRHGGVSNPTQAKALRLSDRRITEMQRQTKAVDALLAYLCDSRRRDDKDRLELLRLVYFDATHTLYGAALQIHVSERTARRYNGQMLEFIGREMGWL